MNTTVITVDSGLAADAADITLNGGFVGIKQVQQRIKYDASIFAVRVAAAAATATQYTILLPTIGNNTTYSIALSQQVNGNYISRVVSTTTPASGGTFATVTADLKLKAEAMGFSFASFTLSTDTITAVGGSGNEIFVCRNISNTTVTRTVVGSYARGNTADVTAQGGTPAAGLSYSKFSILVGTVAPSDGGNSQNVVYQDYTLFVNEAATNFSTFAQGYSNILNGYAVNGGVAPATAIAALSVPATATAAQTAALTQVANIYGVDIFNQA